MGIFGVKRSGCGCRGSWSTLCPDDMGVYCDKLCEQHQIKKGNTVNYNMWHFIKSICKNENYKDEKDLVQVVGVKDVVIVDVVRVKVNGGTMGALLWEIECEIPEMDAAKLDQNKKITFSQFNDKCSWNHISGNRYSFVFVHNPKHVSIDDWIPWDY